MFEIDGNVQSISSVIANIQEFEWILPILPFDGNQEISQVISGQQFFSKLQVEINKNINNGENPDYERKVTGVDIPYSITKRRKGDTAITVADPSLSKKILGWETKRSLFEMCRDSWNWQTKNPNGYCGIKGTGCAFK